jgi:hypothetical protein
VGLDGETTLNGASERKDFNQNQYVSMGLFLSELTLGVVFHNGHFLYTVKPGLYH